MVAGLFGWPGWYQSHMPYTVATLLALGEVDVVDIWPKRLAPTIGAS
jgi:hypothetical protein